MSFVATRKSQSCRAVAPSPSAAHDPYLTNGEVKGVINRRDKILGHFKSLIAEQGEGTVLC